MTEKITPLSREQKQAPQATRPTPAQNAATEVNRHETKSKESDLRPVYQTYIYRSYGGGYQGL